MASDFDKLARDDWRLIDCILGPEHVMIRNDASIGHYFNDQAVVCVRWALSGLLGDLGSFDGVHKAFGGEPFYWLNEVLVRTFRRSFSNRF